MSFLSWFASTRLNWPVPNIVWRRSLFLDLHSYRIDDGPRLLIGHLGQHVDDLSPDLFFELYFDDHGSILYILDFWVGLPESRVKNTCTSASCASLTSCATISFRGTPGPTPVSSKYRSISVGSSFNWSFAVRNCCTC